jgi:hypothetical protein
MSGFKNLYEVFDGRLALPAGEKMYYIPEPDEELGLWCTAFCTAGIAAQSGQDLPPGHKLPPLVLDDEQEKAMYIRILGPVWDDLNADGYGFATQRQFALTALLWIGLGEDAAQTFWNSGGDPKAWQPRRNRRAAQQATVPSTASTRSTGAASTTRGQGSTNGTKPHRPRRAR